MGFTLEKANTDMLGSATKVVITKNSTLIVTDGSTQAAVEQRVQQLKRLVEVQKELNHLKIITFHTSSMSSKLEVTLHMMLHILQNTEENFQKSILNERIARVSGGLPFFR